MKMSQTQSHLPRACGLMEADITIAPLMQCQLLSPGAPRAGGDRLEGFLVCVGGWGGMLGRLLRMKLPGGWEKGIPGPGPTWAKARGTGVLE